jgi:glycosyltransferase involved in cell wall biosynthesis
MTGRLRVLVAGPGAAAASDALRFVAFVPELARHAVELAIWTPGDPTEEPDPFGRLEEVVGWCDVLVLRRFYRTWHACLGCGFRTLDPIEIKAHGGNVGHPVVPAPYFAMRPLVGLLEAEPGVLGERAIVYDTDDDVFSTDLPPGAEDLLERDLVERILGLADLVTVATPVLAERLAAYTRAPVRVIRNALDPAWYDAGGLDGSSDASGEVRVVYHGAAVRLRDYEIARPAVDEVARDLGALRRIWLGGDATQLPGVVDEVRPWVPGVPEFAASLVAARPDIGLAPLRETPYNLARSELHWLEYALAGAPAVASGLHGPGPYDVLRDGIDGLTARSSEDWARQLRRLAASRDLRLEIAGRARERVLADYTVAARAPEWADAYRWAAEHVGVGRARTGASAE